MKYMLLLVAVVFVAEIAAENLQIEDVGAISWGHYKRRFGKRYANLDEESKRRGTFETARRQIMKHNAEAARGEKDYVMGLSELTDVPPSDFTLMSGTVPPPDMKNNATRRPSLQAVTPPISLNYTTSPCMPPVKYQGQCGSCWAFGAVTPIEFLTCNKTIPPSLTLYSESQLVNCTLDYGNQGCNGGWYPSAWDYIRVASLAPSSNFPYYPSTGTCRYKSAGISKLTTISSYSLVPSDQQVIMEILFTSGPLTTTMKVIPASFNYYKSGIYSDPNCPTDCSPYNVNHAVVMVGYGNDPVTGAAFWIIRNSWGTSWGERGYFRIAKGINMCNIECFVYSVTL